MSAATPATRDPLLERLFAVLAGRDDGREWSIDEWRGVLDVATAHAVQPLLAQRSVATAPAAIATELRRIQEETTHRNMRRLRDFATVATALQQSGVDVIALKGMHLVPLVYGNLASRGMIDLDLLIPATQLRAGGDVMRELGYEAARPYRVSDDAIPYYAHHIPPFVKDDASSVELHWHLCPPRTQVAIDVAELWQRAVPARIAGVETKVLANEDLLLHLAVHATYSHRCEVSARACCDVAQIVRTQPLAWDALIERARRSNIAAGTYLVLRLAHELLGARIPRDVLTALEPPAFNEEMLRIALRGELSGSGARRLHNAGGAREKLRVAKELLFINRHDLADAHNVDRSSLRVYGLYVTRLARLARRWREVSTSNSSDAAAIDQFLGGHA